MSDTVWFHVITAITLSTYKIAVLVIGYLIIRLGYSLFMKGVTGEFKFSAEFKGAKTHLISASPGLFLILMGTIVLGIGLYKGLEFATSITGGVECEKCKQSEIGANGNGKPVLPPLPSEEVQK